jgi:hypothetical protein
MAGEEGGGLDSAPWYALREEDNGKSSWLIYGYRHRRTRYAPLPHVLLCALQPGRHCGHAHSGPRGKKDTRSEFGVVQEPILISLDRWHSSLANRQPIAQCRN